MSELVLVANAGGGTISTLRLTAPDPSSGDPDSPEQATLEQVCVSPVGPGCGTFAIDAAHDLVFAAFKEDDQTGDPPGISTMRLDRGTGALTEISRHLVSDSLCYLSLSPDATVLLGASYGGGFAETWPVGKDGVVGRTASRVEFANCHCVVASSEHAYVVSLGDGLVAQYSLSPTGELTPLDPPTVTAPVGSGPRHLVLDGSDAYLMTEYSGEAIHFTVDARGGLHRQESVEVFDPSAGLQHSRIGADPMAEHLIWGADLHRAGSWLLCSERTESTLASVAVDGDGRLGAVVSFTPTQAQPRGFCVTDDGRFVIVVGERSTEAGLSRLEDDGTLTLLGTAGVGRGANWVRVVG